jgi:hypothetical protein
MKPSPKKLCDKAEKLFEKDGKTKTESATAKCVVELTKMKSDEPEKYECASKCINGSDTSSDLGTCMNACEGGSKTASTGSSEDDDSTKTYPVDSLTPSDVRSKISSNYDNFGYDISGEKENAAGWSANVALGKKGGSGEVHIYKVLLLDINGKKDGYSTADRLATGSTAHESRVGNKKLLLVRCLYQRDSTETGVPKECSSYDSKIRSFTDDIAPY